MMVDWDRLWKWNVPGPRRNLSWDTFVVAEPMRLKFNQKKKYADVTNFCHQQDGFLWNQRNRGGGSGTMLVGAVCSTQDFQHWPWQLSGLESNDQAKWELCRAGFGLTQVSQQRISCVGQRKSLTCSCAPKLLMTAIIDGSPLSSLGGSQWMKRRMLDWIHQYKLVKQKQQKKTTQTPVKWFFWSSSVV